MQTRIGLFDGCVDRFRILLEHPSLSQKPVIEEIVYIGTPSSHIYIYIYIYICMNMFNTIK